MGPSNQRIKRIEEQIRVSVIVQVLPFQHREQWIKIVHKGLRPHDRRRCLGKSIPLAGMP